MFETRNAAAETQQEFWIDAIRVRLRPGSLIPQGIDVAVCPA
jgi:hypothetical protein